jgi:hypothetical protein
MDFAKQQGMLIVADIPASFDKAVRLRVIAHDECSAEEWEERTPAENAIWLIRRRTRQLGYAWPAGMAARRTRR